MCAKDSNYVLKNRKTIRCNKNQLRFKGGYYIMVVVNYELIDHVLEDYHYDKSSIIAIMQAIQKEYRFLPQEALEYVADKIKVSIAKIYGVATFYENFSLHEKGKYVIKICEGTACHVRKSADILKTIYQETGLSKEKPTSEDGLFTVEIVSCLGACGLAPTCTVNNVVHSAMTPEKARALIKELREAEADEIE